VLTAGSFLSVVCLIAVGSGTPPTLAAQAKLGSSIKRAIQRRPAAGGARAIIIIVADRLFPEDLLTDSPPALGASLRHAAVAVMSSRAASYDGDAGGYAAIGAGAGVAVPPGPLPESLAGLPEYAHALDAATAQAHTGGVPGSLGQAIQDAGGYTALIGNASGETGYQPEALIAMNASGGITFNDSDRGEITAPVSPLGQSWPYRTRSVPLALASAVESVLSRQGSRPGLIVVAPGDSSRMDRWIWIGHPAPSDARAARARWMPVVLEQLSELIAALRPIAARKKCLLCLVTPVPPRGADGGPVPALTPVVIWGPGYHSGALWSASTRRRGLILSLDLAPFMLEFLGVPPPPSMTGQPLKVSPPPGYFESPYEGAGEMSPTALRSIFSLDARSRSDYDFERWALILYGSLAGLAVFLSAVLPGTVLFGIRARAAQYFVLAGCAGPAALILPMGMPAPGWTGPAGIALALWIIFPLAAFRWRSNAGRIGIACAIPALTLTLDAFSGGRFFRDALWGRMPIAGGRLYGVDNTCTGVYIGAAWIAMGIALDAWIRWTVARGRDPEKARRSAAVAAAVGGLIVACGIGLSPFGANVGGGITAAVGAGFFAARLSGKRGPWIGLALSFLVAAGVLALSLALDTTHALAPGSHLITSLRQVMKLGPGAAWDIAYRKIGQNLALTKWLILPALISMLPIVRMIRVNWPALRQRLAPGQEAALFSMPPAMIAGYLFNDTGVIAAVFVALYFFAAFTYLRLADLAQV